MLELTLLERFLVALALGALIGLEREYATYKHRGHSVAGIRTFPLISLFGALCAYLGQTISPWILVVGILLTGALIIVAYFLISQHSHYIGGATSEVAGFLVFFIGLLCIYDEVTLAVILAVAITIILYTRSILHHFAQKISKEEMADTLKFAVIALVILPLLPNQGYGPYGIFNPYLIWLMVVFVLGISFAGYIAIKWFGEKGVILSGLLGGLVSSTAVTKDFAERSKKESKLYKILALGLILANGVMFVRIFILVVAVNKELTGKLILPLVVLAALTAIFSYVLWKKTEDVHSDIKLYSPFTLGPAIKFGIFFAIILAIVRITEVYFSTKGIYLISILSGIVNVDAITISLSQLAKSSLTLEAAKNGILLAALTNIAVKGGIAYSLGGKEFRKIILILFAVLIVVGLLLMFLL